MLTLSQVYQVHYIKRTGRSNLGSLWFSKRHMCTFSSSVDLTFWFWHFTARDSVTRQCLKDLQADHTSCVRTLTLSAETVWLSPTRSWWLASSSPASPRATSSRQAEYFILSYINIEPMSPSSPPTTHCCFLTTLPLTWRILSTLSWVRSPDHHDA